MSRELGVQMLPQSVMLASL